MAAEHSISPALMAIAAAQATGLIAQVGSIPLGEFAVASGSALLGIVARHFSDAGDDLKNGTLDLPTTLKAVALDIPTAPFLGVVVYLGCSAADIMLLWALGIAAAIGYLGPEYVRVGLQRILDVIVSRKTE